MYRKELAWLEEEEGKEALVFTRLVGLQNERTSRPAIMVNTTKVLIVGPPEVQYAWCIGRMQSAAGTCCPTQLPVSCDPCTRVSHIDHTG